MVLVITGKGFRLVTDERDYMRFLLHWNLFGTHVARG